MLQVFQSDLYQADKFVMTLELVPGREPGGRALDAVMGIARDAFADGRITAVSIVRHCALSSCRIVDQAL